jgi:hypothetical protein
MLFRMLQSFTKISVWMVDHFFTFAMLLELVTLLYHHVTVPWQRAPKGGQRGIDARRRTEYSRAVKSRMGEGLAKGDRILNA